MNKFQQDLVEILKKHNLQFEDGRTPEQVVQKACESAAKHMAAHSEELARGAIAIIQSVENGCPMTAAEIAAEAKRIANLV